MSNAIYASPPPHNEQVLSYAPGTPERTRLKTTLAEMSAQTIDIPLFIGGREVRTGRTGEVRMPHRHGHVLATYHQGGAEEVTQAIEAARAAHKTWSRTPWPERHAIFLRAAELLSTKYRARLNAATMLGQSKTAYQAEIDSACELIDFLRWNCHFATRIYAEQPISPSGTWNRMEARPLEGFIFAVTPFNFTAIAGNLPTAPAILGNTVVWKPAASALYSAWHIVELLREAGLPDGVINLVSGRAQEIGDTALAHPDLAGIHFTGSTEVFHGMWRTVGERIARYRSYPRIVGETGGKDFILAHESAEVDALATAIVRGGYEYQGQKCSAASRIYVPDTLWPKLEPRLCGMISELRMGDVADFRNFMGAVIDRRAFETISGYLEVAEKTGTVLTGGNADRREGWFIEPTLVRVEDPRHRLMQEEIFGPVVTLWVYPARRWREVMDLVDGTSPYALTGAVFAQDRAALAEATETLRDAAGNFYRNDKPTGAVVGQQPFGGGRASGTNDKAGSVLNLWRWVSARSIKETLAPPTHPAYPFMTEE
ncbi:MAG TPA: L-glutamate gamma-semialdehyde dehydrogenase [Polyangia bacterium]|jgi:1-pyrroline-5-carboxylate dehydrogenase|nr:L-glutamate gamma-semialdehyde dehydrogenase [Polyangia bacterium]